MESVKAFKSLVVPSQDFLECPGLLQNVVLSVIVFSFENSTVMSRQDFTEQAEIDSVAAYADFRHA